MKKMRLFLLFLLFCPVLIFAQDCEDEFITVNFSGDTSLQFTAVVEFKKLPRAIKKKFRKHNRPYRNFDDAPTYHFKFAVFSDNIYIVNYRHNGLATHHHISIFDLTQDKITTYIVGGEVKSTRELFCNLLVGTKNSYCKFR